MPVLSVIFLIFWEEKEQEAEEEDGAGEREEGRRVAVRVVDERANQKPSDQAERAPTEAQRLRLLLGLGVELRNEREKARVRAG